MSILASIMSSILGGQPHAAPPPAPAEQQPHGSAPPVASPVPGRATASAAPPARTPQRAPAPPPTPTHEAAAAASQVDVAAVLDRLAMVAGQKLDWRTSIVDLMKLIKIDSSLAARKALAEELNYPGDTHDSTKMNVWLHKQVMAKLAQNGGKLPDDMKPGPLH
jgi:hypothetical protein